MTTPILPFQLERYFARWEFQAPFLLCASDIEGWSMRELLALADAETLRLWENLSLGYTETLGHPLLREAIAGLDDGITSDEILCFAGAEEAIYVTMRVLLRPGEHVIVTVPAYQSLYEVAQTIGAEVSFLLLRPQSGREGLEWTIDIDELRGLLRPNTRLVVCNFPHNPTGALPAPAVWEELLQVVREAGCYLFSDEVYRLLEYQPADRLPAAAGQYDRALSLGVMSKPFGMAGLRIGWLACRDAALRGELAAYKDYTTICNSAPSEILALIALRAKDAVLERSLSILRANLSQVDAFMERQPDRFAWFRPRAGSIAFPRWLGPVPVRQFCEDLVQDQGVLLLPAGLFDYPGPHFRLGLGRKNLPEALERLEHFLARYDPRSGNG